MRDLGTLGGVQSFGLGINSSGYVTGWSPITSVIANLANHAFLYDGITMHDLSTLGGHNSMGAGINDSGYVTGTSETAASGDRAFLYDGITMHDLGTLGGQQSFGYGINNSGQVTGEAHTFGNAALHAFLYDGITMHDLGTLGGNGSAGQAINNSGQVAGYAQTAALELHAFLYDGATMHDLGTLGGSSSSGLGINNFGKVVGFSSLTSGPGPGPEHAFLYDGNSMLDLNSHLDSSGANWVLARATGINDAGQIVGWGTRSGVISAFLLTPPKLYNVCLLYDATKAIKSGSTLPVKLQLCDSTGADLSSPAIIVHATGISQTSTSVTGDVEDPGNANPDSDFRFDSTLGSTGGYIFNLKTAGLTTGTYALNFTATGDSFGYMAPFQVK
jgi:probable HAF family extracellular repeat protein